MKQRLLLPALLMLAIACGKKDDSTTTSSSSLPDNALAGAYAVVASQTEALSSINPGGSGSKRIVNNLTKSMLAAPEFGTSWSGQDAFPDDRTADGSPAISLKEWMGNQISDEAVRDNGSKIGVLGRLRNNLELLCALSIGLGDVDGDGYPDNGTQTVTFTQGMLDDVESECDMDVSDVSAGFEMDFTVADATDTTVYDKVVTIDPVPGGGTQTIHLRSTATEINVGSVEIYTHDSVEWVGRTILQMDVTNGVYRGEYISSPNTNGLGAGTRVEGWRVLWDALNVEAFMIARMHEESSDTYHTFSVSGKPETDGSNISVSFKSTGFNGMGGLDSDLREICVAANTGDPISGGDGDVCAAVSGVSAAGLTVTDATALDVFDNTFNATLYNSIDNGDLTFTKANINTTAFTLD